MATHPAHLRGQDVAHRGPLPRGTLPDLVGGGALALAASIGLAGLLGLSPATVTLAAALHVGGALLAARGARRAHGHHRFGPANRITTLRLAGTAVLGGVTADAGGVAAAGAGGAWMLVAMILVLLALDGIDGWAARRSGLASSFGARYDLEVDAALILILAVLAWQLGTVGAWVLAIGLLRYAFVLASLHWRWLAAPLPASLRRKAWCVVQVSVLCALVSPWFPPPWSQGLALIALAGLVHSFALDIAWLRRRALSAAAAGRRGRAGRLPG